MIKGSPRAVVALEVNHSPFIVLAPGETENGVLPEILTEPSVSELSKVLVIELVCPSTLS